MWGGLKKDPESNGKMVPVTDLEFLYVFRASSETWDKLRLKGQHPPGISQGSCVRIGETLFLYGFYMQYGGVLWKTSCIWRGKC